MICCLDSSIEKLKVQVLSKQTAITIRPICKSFTRGCFKPYYQTTPKPFLQFNTNYHPICSSHQRFARQPMSGLNSTEL